MSDKIVIAKFRRTFRRTPQGVGGFFVPSNPPVLPAPSVFRQFSRRSANPVGTQRGMAGILSVITSGGSLSEAPTGATSQPWWIPDLFYDYGNNASPDQVYAANQAANAGIVQAETDPITGQIVPAAQAYANATAGAAGAAEQAGMTQSTGSPIADAFDSLFGSLTGAPGSTPLFGSLLGGGSSPTSGFPWEEVLIIGAVVGGGILVVKYVL
jgi:hypothetical protein